MNIFFFFFFFFFFFSCRLQVLQNLIISALLMPLILNS